MRRSDEYQANAAERQRVTHNDIVANAGSRTCSTPQIAVFIPDFGADRVLDRRTTRAGKMVKDRRFEHFADQIALRSLPALGAC